MSDNERNLDIEKIILTYWPQINFRVRKSLGVTNSDWEDVAADVLMDAVRALKNGIFKGKSSVGTFIYVITSRRINDYLREKYRKLATLFLDENQTVDPIDRVKRREGERLLWDAIKRLKPRQADMLYLHYYLGLTQKEVAKIFGLSTRRVSELLKHARQILKRIMTNKGRETSEAVGHGHSSWRQRE